MSKPNMMDLLRQAQQMQDDLARVQEMLEGMTVDGTAGGGAVTVTVNGKQRIQSMKIDPDVVKAGDVEMLEDLVAVAVNQALEKSADMAREELQKVGGGLVSKILAGGLRLPGLNL